MGLNVVGLGIIPSESLINNPDLSRFTLFILIHTTMSYFIQERDRDIKNILYVNGFPQQLRSRDLYQLFYDRIISKGRSENIKSVNMYTSKKGRYALIQFGSYNCIKKAKDMSVLSIKYDNKFYDINMHEYLTKYQRQQRDLDREMGEISYYNSRSRSRERSRSRSRSRSKDHSVERNRELDDQESDHGHEDQERDHESDQELDRDFLE